MDALLVGRHLVDQPVCPQVIAVVRGEDDDRVLPLPLLDQETSNPPHHLVDGHQRAHPLVVLVLRVRDALRSDRRLLAEPPRFVMDVVLVVVRAPRQFVFPRASGVLDVPGGRRQRQMRRRGGQADAEGLPARYVALQEFDGLVRQEVGDVLAGGVLGRAPARAEVGHLVAVSGVHVVAADRTPPLPAGIRRVRSPGLAEITVDVAEVAQADGELGRSLTAERRRPVRSREREHAGIVGQAAREEGATPRRADRRRRERVLESQAVVHHARRLGHGLPVRRVIVLVVEQQDEEVRPRWERRRL